MQRKVILMLGGLALAGSGCGSRSPLVQTEQAQYQQRVIVHLETRSEVTTIMSGPNGRLYTVRARDGRTLEEEISEQQLRASFPAVYELLKTSYAGGGNGVTVWAGQDL